MVDEEEVPPLRFASVGMTGGYLIVTWSVVFSPSVMVSSRKPSSFNRSKKVASSATVRSWKNGDRRYMVVILASSARMR